MGCLGRTLYAAGSALLPGDLVIGQQPRSTPAWPFRFLRTPSTHWQSRTLYAHWLAPDW
jgi:hypothetical protein